MKKPLYIVLTILVIIGIAIVYYRVGMNRIAPFYFSSWNKREFFYKSECNNDDYYPCRGAGREFDG